jgi:hypothetical protein
VLYCLCSKELLHAHYQSDKVKRRTAAHKVKQGPTYNIGFITSLVRPQKTTPNPIEKLDFKPPLG